MSNPKQFWPDGQVRLPGQTHQPVPGEADYSNPAGGAPAGTRTQAEIDAAAARGSAEFVTDPATGQPVYRDASWPNQNPGNVPGYPGGGLAPGNPGYGPDNPGYAPGYPGGLSPGAPTRQNLNPAHPDSVNYRTPGDPAAALGNQAWPGQDLRGNQNWQGGPGQGPGWHGQGRQGYGNQGYGNQGYGNQGYGGQDPNFRGGQDYRGGRGRQASFEAALNPTAYPAPQGSMPDAPGYVPGYAGGPVARGVTGPPLNHWRIKINGSGLIDEAAVRDLLSALGGVISVGVTRNGVTTSLI